MQQTQPGRSRMTLPEPDGSVSDFAGRVLSVLASRRRPADARHLNESHLALLSRAAHAADPGARRAALNHLRSEGVPSEDICDVYVPAIARRMGEAWMQNALSFAEVSIATARLQAVLHDVGPPCTAGSGSRSVAVVVPEGEDHTLGAIVLTQQLRRRGLSVRLHVRRAARELVDLLAESDASAIFVSLSSPENIGPVGDLISDLRRSRAAIPPIIVGGSIMLTGEAPLDEVIGADLVTCDIDAALGMVCPGENGRVVPPSGPSGLADG